MKNKRSILIRGRGFTLLEVLVALAIVSIGLLSMSAALSRSVNISDQLEHRTVASWVASNKMAELRMERVFRASGGSNSQASLAGREWSILETYYPTNDPNISRVTVEVFVDGDEKKLATSTGFLARHKE